MKMEEAINTGKPAKRRSWAEYIVFNLENKNVYNLRGELLCGYASMFTLHDILADDWETKE